MLDSCKCSAMIGEVNGHFVWAILKPDNFQSLIILHQSLANWHLIDDNCSGINHGHISVSDLYKLIEPRSVLAFINPDLSQKGNISSMQEYRFYLGQFCFRASIYFLEVSEHSTKLAWAEIFCEQNRNGLTPRENTYFCTHWYFCLPT